MIRNVLRTLPVVLLLFAASAHAQLFRAYLSITGADTNPCTVSQPCRLLPAALAAVADGGEIWMLDSANYNTSTVNIAKSVTILAIPGAVGSIVAIASTPAIIIGAPFVNVALRNVVVLSIITSPGTTGISMISGSSLNVENSLFQNIPQTGIDVQLSAFLRVSGSTFRNVGAGSNQYAAINIAQGATGEVVDTTISGGSGYAVKVFSNVAGMTSKGTVINVKATNTGNCAYSAFNSSVSGAIARLDVTHSSATQSAGGACVQGDAGARMTVSDATIQGNIYYGMNNLGPSSVLKSFGNNSVSDNSGAGDTVGAITSTAFQ